MKDPSELEAFFRSCTPSAALQELRQQLGPMAAHLVKNKSDRALLKAVMELMVSFVSTRLEPTCAEPFAAIYSGLSALDRGVVLDVMRPNTRRGRSKNTNDKSELKAFAAALVDTYRNSFKLPLPEALRKTADLLRRNGVKTSFGSHQSLTPKTIDNWRQSVARDRKLHDRRRTYGGLLKNTKLADLEKATDSLIAVLQLT